mmetsp:Transcript_12384/g.20094  ORF Transcript_12384/g.20094 Transcript_12384/m.20094 type:complete len:97 (+) Transcript_12384:495-785(+)
MDTVDQVANTPKKDGFSFQRERSRWTQKNCKNCQSVFCRQGCFCSKECELSMEIRESPEHVSHLIQDPFMPHYGEQSYSNENGQRATVRYRPFAFV